MIGTRDMSGQELRRREVYPGASTRRRMGETCWVCDGALATVRLWRWQLAAVPLRRDQDSLIRAGTRRLNKVAPGRPVLPKVW